MDDLVRVHVVASSYELDHEKASFRFGETAAATKHIHERTVVAKFECHVDVLFVFETFLEPDDIGVLEGAVDLDFGVELSEARGQLTVAFVALAEANSCGHLRYANSMRDE